MLQYFFSRQSAAQPVIHHITRGPPHGTAREWAAAPYAYSASEAAICHGTKSRGELFKPADALQPPGGNPTRLTVSPNQADRLAEGAREISAAMPFRCLATSFGSGSPRRGQQRPNHRQLQAQPTYPHDFYRVHGDTSKPLELRHPPMHPEPRVPWLSACSRSEGHPLPLPWVGR
jgi:hypothetical protein